jgi:type VI secretion system secreted protein VgrG
MSLPEELTLTLESKDFPCEHLRVHAVEGTERIGRLFDFKIEVVCVDPQGPDAEVMAGARVTLVIERSEGAGPGWHGTRRIHGIVAEVADLLAVHAAYRVYRLRLVPRAYLLGMVQTQQIFMGKTVPEIIRHKLGSIGLGEAVDMRLHATYPAREFVVQYKETDLAFLSRLAEHLGVSFFFEHDDEGDRIVWSDQNSGFRAVPGAEKLVYQPRGERRGVHELEAHRRIIPAFYVVSDYNYRMPLVDLTSLYELPTGFAGGVVDHGGHFKTPAEGDALVRIRAEERQATQLVYSGRCSMPVLSAGTRFVLDDHPTLPPTDLIVTEVAHRASFMVGDLVSAGEPGYSCAFQAMPADRAYRPPQETPRPRIAGIVQGVIDAGPGGSVTRAQIDEQGRYLVRFLFDQSPPNDRAPSRPVRMAQNHVGESYGAHNPLKPGTEVLLSFIDGDPDRPIIVGAVYNTAKPSPVDRSNAITHRFKTQTGITVDMVEKT